jgi:hypothetical protein
MTAGDIQASMIQFIRFQGIYCAAGCAAGSDFSHTPGLSGDL